MKPQAGSRPQLWRRLRQAAQILSLLLFLSSFVIPGSDLSTVFHRLNPLVALTAMLAGRAAIAGMLWAGVTLVLTLLFGRVWCGWVCPLGTLLEWIKPPSRRSRPEAPADRWRSFKYVLLLTMLFAALLGSQTLLFLDPITIMTRSVAAAVWPAARYAVYGAEAFLYRFKFLWGPLDAVHDAVVYPVLQGVESVMIHAAVVFLFFVGIVALNWWAERFWCRYLCPLGGLLGLLSKLALVRREAGEACTQCARCSRDCPLGAIDPERAYQSDPAECTVCYDCIVSCPPEGNGFRWQLPQWRPAGRETYDPGRRDALLALGTAVVGVALAGVEPVAKRQPARMIRPPGATLIDFEALCIRCGECVRVCPTQGLQPSLVEGGWQNLMAPRLVPRLGYCSYSCNVCGEVCPTGAIPRLGLEQKQRTCMGLARVDRDLCLPWAYDVPCIVCEEACPLPEKAIRLDEAVVDGEAGQVTLQRPDVVKELCIGCGICEYQCPMGGDAAIQVYTPTEAGGSPPAG